jgi:hypothetical protein
MNQNPRIRQKPQLSGKKRFHLKKFPVNQNFLLIFNSIQKRQACFIPEKIRRLKITRRKFY